MFLLQPNLSTLDIHDIPILTIQQISLFIYEVCAFINKIVLAFMTISVYSFERGLFDTFRRVRLDCGSGFLTTKSSRYYNRIGDRVDWIVEGLSLEGVRGDLGYVLTVNIISNYFSKSHSRWTP